MNLQELKIIFMGTPDFAGKSLEKLIENKCDIEAVFTQPDKPKGRGYKLMPSPVKVIAEENNIKVYQPKSLRKGEDGERSLNVIKEINPDVIVVVAYGQILPKSILDIPKMGCINIHGSLLPAYRGAAPIEWCVINGEKETGVTSMYMGEGLDTGDMLIKRSTPIGKDETASQLRDRLAVIGADVLIETLEGLINGTISPEKQDDSKSNYAVRITKDMSHLDFTKSAEELHNIIRAISGYTMMDGKRLKVYKSAVVENIKSAEPGEIVDTKKFITACGDGKGIEFLEIQPEGKKRMKVEDYLRGKKLEMGYKFG